MAKEEIAFLILKTGFISGFFFAALIFYSRIKENVGIGVDNDVFQSAIDSTKESFYMIVLVFLVLAISIYFFGNDTFG